MRTPNCELSLCKLPIFCNWPTRNAPLGRFLTAGAFVYSRQTRSVVPFPVATALVMIILARVVIILERAERAVNVILDPLQ
jgi:hypothetical protein